MILAALLVIFVVSRAYHVGWMRGFDECSKIWKTERDE